jgi:hypothetical protein
MHRHLIYSLLGLSTAAAEPAGLIVDLNAAKGLVIEDGDRVAKWTSEVAGAPAREFVKRDQGRKEPGSGRPTLRKDVKELNGKPALLFLQQELTCMEEDTFDNLTTGGGHTWFVVLAIHEQRVGLKDVNSFFGNLRNSDNYEGVWGCFNDDNTLWIGVRNSVTFGRFDTNNPQLIGPKLIPGKFHVIAGRLGAGTGTVKIELFVDGLRAVASADFPVSATANPSRLSIGQERDAIQHPGVESFDGEIARFQMFDRPLSDAELAANLASLRQLYGL